MAATSVIAPRDLRVGAQARSLPKAEVEGSIASITNVATAALEYVGTFQMTPKGLFWLSGAARQNKVAIQGWAIIRARVW
jgi:hypothetical protein